MTWVIKSKSEDGKVASTLCDNADKAKTVIQEERDRGREAWVEDAEGARLDEKLLGEKSGGWN